MNAGCEKCNIGELRLDGSSTDILLSGRTIVVSLPEKDILSMTTGVDMLLKLI